MRMLYVLELYIKNVMIHFVFGVCYFAKLDFPSQLECHSEGGKRRRQRRWMHPRAYVFRWVYDLICLHCHSSILLLLCFSLLLFQIPWFHFCIRFFLTLSTFIFLNAPCKILKFWMYSCSKFVRNLTRFIGTEPGKSISMYWQ